METKWRAKGRIDFLKDREMRTIRRLKKLVWKRVLSGVPQGSVLTLIMFVVYANYISENMDSYISLFADNAKLMKRIKRKEDFKVLQ